MTLALRLAQPDMQGLTDWQAADALNVQDAANGTMRVPVRSADVRDYLIYISGDWGMIKHWTKVLPTGTKFSAAGTTGTFSQVDLRCAAVTNFVEAIDARDVLPLDNATAATKLATDLDNLVAFGFISAATRTAIIALGSRNISWAEANGYPAGVTARDVSLARGGRA